MATHAMPVEDTDLSMSEDGAVQDAGAASDHTTIAAPVVPVVPAAPVASAPVAPAPVDLAPVVAGVAASASASAAAPAPAPAPAAVGAPETAVSATAQQVAGTATAQQAAGPAVIQQAPAGGATATGVAGSVVPLGGCTGWNHPMWASRMALVLALVVSAGVVGWGGLTAVRWSTAHGHVRPTVCHPVVTSAANWHTAAGAAAKARAWGTAPGYKFTTVTGEVVQVLRSSAAGVEVGKASEFTEATACTYDERVPHQGAVVANTPYWVVVVVVVCSLGWVSVGIAVRETAVQVGFVRDGGSDAWRVSTARLHKTVWSLFLAFCAAVVLVVVLVHAYVVLGTAGHSGQASSGDSSSLLLHGRCYVERAGFEPVQGAPAGTVQYTVTAQMAAVGAAAVGAPVYRTVTGAVTGTAAKVGTVRLCTYDTVTRVLSLHESPAWHTVWVSVQLVALAVVTLAGVVALERVFSIAFLQMPGSVLNSTRVALLASLRGPTLAVAPGVDGCVYPSCGNVRVQQAVHSEVLVVALTAKSITGVACVSAATVAVVGVLMALFL